MYLENIYDCVVIEVLVDVFMVSLCVIIMYCSSFGCWGWMFLDYLLVGFDQVILDGVLEVYFDGVEDIYLVMLLQQGLIYYFLFDLDGGIYLIQMDFSLLDVLDVDWLVVVWQWVLVGYVILCIVFVQFVDSCLLQVVQFVLVLFVQWLDWCVWQNDVEVVW